MLDVLKEIFINPFVYMGEDPIYLVNVVLLGLISGVLYALVALGFALIYKASGVFNFAQGIFVVFAALGLIAFNNLSPNLLAPLSAATLLGGCVLFYFNRALNVAGIAMLAAGGLLLLAVGYLYAPIVMALFMAVAMMIALAFATERFMLRQLVNQPQIILFMATIGLFFFLEGLGETIFGGSVRSIPMADLGMERASLLFGGIRLQQTDLIAALVAAAMVTLLALMFRFTGIGRALRAVADDHQAAMSVGIPLNNMWVVVWAIAGIVALVAGIMWGASAGSVSFSLVNIALKALPVLILGGFTSIPGVIVGGLIIGVGEKVFEIYWDDVFPGTTEEWFAYVLALIVLLFRQQGLFGEKIIERV
jgi:branched-chain amino acid transport system permease protein